MNNIAVVLTVISCFSLVGCGEAEPEEPLVFEQSPEEIARSKAAFEEEQAEYAAIEYPECGAIWQDGKLSECGRKRLQLSLDFCDEEHGSGFRLDPSSAGDSWIARAGRGTMQTVEERAQRISEGDYISEGISYAEGDGTNSIKIVRCLMDESSLRVTNVYSTFK